MRPEDSWSDSAEQELPGKSPLAEGTLNQTMQISSVSGCLPMESLPCNAAALEVADTWTRDLAFILIQKKHIQWNNASDVIEIFLQLLYSIGI